MNYCFLFCCHLLNYIYALDLIRHVIGHQEHYLQCILLSCLWCSNISDIRIENNIIRYQNLQVEIGKLYRNGVSEKKNMKKLELLVHYCRLLPFLTIFIFCFFFFILDQNEQILGQNQVPSKSINESSVVDYPSLLDNNLKIETVARGFAFPTGITGPR